LPSEKVPAPPKTPGVFCALAHQLAALQYDGAKPHLGQQQGGEQTARPRPDHHRPRFEIFGRACAQFIFGIGRGFDMRIPTRQHRCLISHRNVQCIDKEDGGFFAGILATPDNGEGFEITGRNAQLFDDGGGKRGLIMVQRQFYFGQAQHGIIGSVLLRRTDMRRAAPDGNLHLPLPFAITGARCIAARRMAGGTGNAFLVWR
jgi:hypothetical protein